MQTLKGLIAGGPRGRYMAGKNGVEPRSGHEGRYLLE